MAKNPNVFVLIVGVGDYSTYDPSGRTNLRGARNDVEAWRYYLQYILELEEDQYLLLTDEDGASQTSRASIAHGLHWLGQKMGEVDGRSGLMAFSGHGLALDAPDSDDEGMSLAIAPSDITSTFGNAMAFVDIQERLDLGIRSSMGDGADPATAARILENITVALDCCYTASSGARALQNTLLWPSDLEEGAEPVAVGLADLGARLRGSYGWELAWCLHVRAGHHARAVERRDRRPDGRVVSESVLR